MPSSYDQSVYGFTATNTRTTAYYPTLVKLLSPRPQLPYFTHSIPMHRHLSIPPDINTFTYTDTHVWSHNVQWPYPSFTLNSSCQVSTPAFAKFFSAPSLCFHAE